MTSVHRYMYLHGFASSQFSVKGVLLKTAFQKRGFDLLLADLNWPSFSEITYSNALSVLVRLDAERPGGPWFLVGSSLGGYIAARFAGLYPDRVRKLVLLAPAFDLLGRWPRILGEQAVADWKRTGFREFKYGFGSAVNVSANLLLDAERHPPAPDVYCPTLIIHGIHDDVVPVEVSRNYAQSRPNVQLLEIDDDHGLVTSADLIAAKVLEFFEL